MDPINKCNLFWFLVVSHFFNFGLLATPSTLGLSLIFRAGVRQKPQGFWKVPEGWDKSFKG